MISNVKYGKREKSYYAVSVIVLTYQQSLEKILLTLASIVDQKDVDFEVIISDDGSRETYVAECSAFFEKYNFYEYTIISHDINQGTVKNYKDAIEYAEGEYIKDFGPGDCFYCENSLKLWLEHIKKEGSQLSFCDSIYYRKIENGYECVVEVAHPQKPEVYKKRNSLQKKYYLLYNDIFLGAAILVKRQLLKKYILLMADRIKYAEDNIYRVMLLEGISCTYFNDNAIYYEWGDGVSTKSDSEFSKALANDWKSTTDYICDNCQNCYVDKLVKSHYDVGENTSKFKISARIYAWIARSELMIFSKKNSKKKRLTQMSSVDYLKKLEKF